MQWKYSEQQATCDLPLLDNYRPHTLIQEMSTGGSTKDHHARAGVNCDL